MYNGQQIIVVYWRNASNSLKSINCINQNKLPQILGFSASRRDGLFKYPFLLVSLLFQTRNSHIFLIASIKFKTWSFLTWWKQDISFSDYFKNHHQLINPLHLSFFDFHSLLHRQVEMAAKSNRSSYNLSWLPVTIFAHLLVIAVTILVLVWLLQFREGLAFKSDNKQKIFNVYNFLRNLLFTSTSCIVLHFSLGSVLQVHPLLMVIGFLLVLGEGKRYIINKIGSN